MGFFKWLVDFLKKIGILKVKGSSYKGNLKNRSVDFIDEAE